MTILNITSTTRYGLLFFSEAEDDLLLLQEFELAEVELLLDILLTGECLVYQMQLPSLGKATKFSRRYSTFLLRVVSTKLKFYNFCKVTFVQSPGLSLLMKDF